MKMPRYVQHFVDRHGHARFYFRREGRKRVPLPGLPWSPEFMAAYELAMKAGAEEGTLGAKRTMPGTFSALMVAFYNSAEFKSWAAETQRTRRNILERFRASTTEAGLRVGDCRVAHLGRQRFEKMVAAKVGTPAAARNFVKTMRVLMQFATANGYRDDDPTTGVKLPKNRTAGFETWGEEHIAAYEAKHAIGTRARLALALLLYTAQRRGDVVRMGRQHVRDGVLQVKQQKTRTALQIPVHPELARILDATPADNMTFLMTEFGKPFTAAGFGNLFRDWCEEAGLPKGLSAHGLRKAGCRRLAELGCSANQIMAISGHRSLAEAEKYVRAADQARLARSAMDALVRAFPGATGTSGVNPE